MRLSLNFLRRPYVPAAPSPATQQIVSRRLIIRPQMLAADDRDNINVPSLIRVPDWVEQPLGRYYLYFGSHAGAHQIRLAYADKLDGPWNIHPEGALRAEEIPAIGNYVAAPDAHVDGERRHIRMYFHGSTPQYRKPRAFVATSDDGLHFHARPEVMGRFYFRAFPYRDGWYALSKGGRLYHSSDGLAGFTRGPNAFPHIPGNSSSYNAPGSIRHVAIEVFDGHAEIYYSRIGDAPEAILKSRLDLAGNWRRWRAGPPEDVLRPQEEWEGADLPIEPSRLGRAADPVNQVRDPDIFTDADGARYLLYTVAGEQGIAIARFVEKKPALRQPSADATNVA